MLSSRGIVFLGLAGVLSIIVELDAAKPRRMKTPKPINWDDPYYSGKFDLCKKLRVFNPVELVRAQAWATAAFRKCGPKLIIKYATKNNFPAYGIERIVQLGCYGINFVYSFFSGDGALIIPDGLKTARFFEMGKALHRSLAVSNHNFTVKYRGETLLIPIDLFAEFSFAVLACVFDEDTITQNDGDYLKHGMSHVKYLLL